MTVPPPPTPRKMKAEFIGVTNEEILDQPNTWPAQLKSTQPRQDLRACTRKALRGRIWTARLRMNVLGRQQREAISTTGPTVLVTPLKIPRDAASHSHGQRWRGRHDHGGRVRRIRHRWKSHRGDAGGYGHPYRRRHPS